MKEGEYMGPYFYYYDPTYILVFIGVILSLLASAKVNPLFQSILM